MTVNDIASMSGYSVTSIRRAIELGSLRASKLGRFRNSPIDVDESEFRRWLASERRFSRHPDLIKSSHHSVSCECRLCRRGDTCVRMQVLVPALVRDEIHRLADKFSLSASEVVRMALDHYIVEDNKC